jgi:sialic acid synthase SpsE
MTSRKIFIIAEIGVNHNGKISEAFRLIDEAKKCGADAVKFQTYITDELVLKDAPMAEHHKKNMKKKTSHYEILKKLELKFDDFVKLKKYTKGKKMKFISTPYDITSLLFLIKIKCDYIKFASSELLNFPMLDLARKSNIPIIISTGMSSLNEVKQSIDFIMKKNKRLIVLKCTSDYPAEIETLNLRGLKSLQDIYKEKIFYGFSDHSEGSIAAVTALKYDIKFIEKHFTLNKNLNGPDHKASTNPKELKLFIQDINNSIKADGFNTWKLGKQEIKQKKTMRKGCYARTNIKKGEILKSNNIIYLRPPNTLSPKDLFLYCLNKKVKKNIKKGSSLKKEYF